MSVACPNCAHVIKLKGVKAGRYAPKCPNCTKAFSLVVSGEEGNYEFTAKAAAAPAKPVAAAASAAKPATRPIVKPVPKPPAPPPPPVEEKPKPKPAPPPVKSVPKPLPPPPEPEPEPPADDPDSTGADFSQAAADPDSTAAVMDQPPDDPDSTSGYLAGAAAPVAEDSDSPAFDKTEFHDASHAETERTTAGTDDNADFSADGSPEEPPEEDEGDKKKKKKKKKKAEDDIPSQLGGYEVVEALGQGGMGTVYLARQISLDRPVALKVMNERWASDPVFVARFTREAYAAAQLVHHNVVQIYDIGCDQNIHYFSMEFVKGKTLSDLVKNGAKVDVEEAVGYILQAARGLKAAHDAGMVHRDVKPDNLMLNDLGVVKVADLGLVKTPGAPEPGADGQAEEESTTPKKPSKATKGSLSSMPSVTNVGAAMGTPTYMPPEQARNAATVDQRADIYSLGCTLYVLVTGRVPFKGNTALEVMVKHQNEEPIPPETIAKRVPKEISALVLKMMAKKPEDRHQSMAEVIEEGEKFLGVSRVGPFTPGDEQADALEEAVKGFNNAPAAKLRSKAIPLIYLSYVGLAVFCLFAGWPRIAVSVTGLALMTAFFTFLVRGLSGKTYLFSKAREFVLGSGWSDWLTWGAALLLLLGLLFVAGILTYWLAFVVLSGLAAGAIRALIDRPLERQREKPIEQAEKLLKQLRLRGLPEEAVRQFVCKYSGQHWEEFFETLFGYEALLHARKQWSRPEGGKPRPTYAAWRDPVVQWIDARQRARQEAKERRMLRALEQKKLEAEGVSAAKAKEQAEQAAAVMVSAGAALKQQAAVEQGGLVETSAVPVNVQEALKAAEKPRSLSPEEKKKLTQSTKGPGLAAFLFGPKLRFLLGAGLVVLCILWIQSNELTDVKAGEELDYKTFTGRLAKADATGNLGFLPKPIDGVLSGFTVGLAGLLLVLSALSRSKALLFFFLLAVAVLLAAPLALTEPIMGIGPRYIALLAGFLLAEFGFVFARSAAKPKAA